MTLLRGRAEPAAALLAAAALMALLPCTVAWEGDLPINMIAQGAGIVTNENEQVVAEKMMRGMLEVAEEIRTGQERPPLVAAMEAPGNLTAVNASAIQAKVSGSVPLTAWMLLQREALLARPVSVALSPPPGNRRSAPHSALCRASPQIFARALATWQMGVWNSPYNKGLRPKKLNFYDRDHYYQVPDNPIGTVSGAAGTEGA